MKQISDYANFQDLDIRVGRVENVEDAKTIKPSYKITINFGPEVGTKVSCGAYRNYVKEDLIGKLIVAIVNFPAKKMGPEVSEVLVLGVGNEKGETIYLTPQSEVGLGSEVY